MKISDALIEELNESIVKLEKIVAEREEQEMNPTERKVKGGAQSASAPRASHTPGPWRCAPKLSGSENHKGYRVEYTRGDTQWWLAEVMPIDSDGEEGGANARLIAAAPDLLAACEAVFKAHGNFLAELPEELEEQLSAAIKKARGE